MLFFGAIYGGQTLYGVIDSIQGGLTGTLITNVLLPNIAGLRSLDTREVQEMIVGSAKLLTDSPIAQAADKYGALLKVSVQLLDASAGGRSTGGADDGLSYDDDAGAENRDFDSAYSRLAYAQLPETAFTTPEITNAAAFFSSVVAPQMGSAQVSHASIVRALDAYST
jgi:CAS/CSE protein, C-terminus